MRYRVLRYNPETQTATLQGNMAEFEVHPFTKEKVQHDGYRLEKENA